MYRTNLFLIFYRLECNAFCTHDCTDFGICKDIVCITFDFLVNDF